MLSQAACVTLNTVRNLGYVVPLVAVSAFAQQLPAISGQTLTGRDVTLPAAVAGLPAVLFIGFSRSSQKSVEGWSKPVATQLSAAHPEAVRYNIAVIQDAPRLLRGMITRGMKSSVPVSQHDRFLVVTQGEEELKKAAGFSAADDAYLLLLDPSGKVRWRTHGDVSEAGLKELADQVEGVSETRKTGTSLAPAILAHFRSK